MEEKMNDLLSKKFTVLLGDMNAIVREGREGDVVGPHGLEKKNERGRILIDLCMVQESRKKEIHMDSSRRQKQADTNWITSW